MTPHFDISTSGVLQHADNVVNTPIPSSVTSIASGKSSQYVFQGSTNTLQKISFAGNDLVSIGSYAFSHCEKLTEVDMSNCFKCTSIGDYAFTECYNLKTFNFPPSERLDLGDNAFRLCSINQTLDLTKIFPQASTFIGNPMSFTCSNTHQNLREYENNIYNINYNYLTYVSSSTTNLTIHPQTTIIGSSAFATSSLSEVVLPPSITTLEIYAFHFSKIKILILSQNIKSIEYQNIHHNLELETLFIPEGLSVISSEAISDNPKLKYIKIPKTMIEVKSNAFPLNNKLECISYSPEQFSMLLNAGLPFRALTGCKHTVLERKSYTSAVFILIASFSKA